jgi:tripartite-type tricarboxylate transporter receptor subunit TctC
MTACRKRITGFAQREVWLTSCRDREHAMKLPRRHFLRLAAGAAALPALARPALAQPYPARPVRLVVGFPPGGAADIGARLVAQYLSERIERPFVVENRPGAAGNLATEMVVRAPADGYTLALINSSQAINATLYGNLSYKFVRDIAPVACFYHQPLVLEVNRFVPATTIAELIAYAGANGGKVNMASSGIGSPQHMAGELFKMMTGVDMQHVPYRGSAPALTDLMAGQVQVMFDTLNSSIEHLRSGSLRALAVTTATRSGSLPEVPTVGDSVPGYEVVGWSGLGAPRGTPVEIVARLNREINAGLGESRLKDRFTELGVTVLALSPASFGALIAEDTAKWAKVVEFSGAKPG